MISPTTIDEIMFPGECRRTLSAQIECLDRMLAAIDSTRPQQQDPPKEDSDVSSR